MASPSDLSVPMINAVLQEPLFTVLLLPIGYGVFRFIEYVLRRKLEGKPESEKLDQYHKLVDLQEKLNKTGKTMADLDALRAHALGHVADSAIIQAQTYTIVAQKLVSDFEAVGNDGGDLFDRDSRELSQAELNELSGQKAAQADDELSAIIGSKLRGMDEQMRQALLHSQAAWENFRNMESSRESQRWEGGSVRPLMVNLRYEALTRERIAVFSSEEGLEQADIVVEHSKTPNNLFDRIEQYVPYERVIEWLGAPSYHFGNSCQYRYEETQVEIWFNSNNAVKEVVVALVQGQIYAGVSPAGALSIPLGVLTLQDVLDIDEYTTIQYAWSARTEEVFVRGRTGPPGAWTDYCFGALKVFSGAGLLQETAFEWDSQAERLITDPKDVLINWMAFGSEDGAPFSWFIK
ncbi:lysozyme inhibitor LprI family protein [Pseudomonas sp. CHM02]|uniref:lysozyme inhibitor LprI family protein n=1 Tax=Pseudomonas sp. CHM02 TaxID=1463662 RepID=UPI00046F11D7|nr:lysozyme inhibitor LprI family protein [Pseudomonas sp. CHM02]